MLGCGTGGWHHDRARAGERQPMLLWCILLAAAVITVLRVPALRRHWGVGGSIALTALRLFALALAALLTLPISLTTPHTVTQPARVAVLLDVSQSVDTAAWRRATQTVAALAQKHGDTVTVWAFGDQLTRLVPSRPPPRPTAMASRLSVAVRQLVDTARPDQLVIIADGQDTDPLPDATVIATLQRAGTRVIAVPLPAILPPNLQVSVSPTQLAVFAGEMATVTVTVSGQHLRQPVSVPVSVWEGQRLVQRQQMRVASDKIATVSLRLHPTKAGWHRYRVEAAPLSGERWRADNAVTVAVWQAPTKLRVLTVAGQPTFEFKFLRQALAEDTSIEWAALAALPDSTRYQQGSSNLLPVSLERLAPFHVVITLAPTPADLSAAEAQNLRDFVQAGGGWLLTLNAAAVAAQIWRWFFVMPLQVISLPALAPLQPVADDMLGRTLQALPPADAAWALQSRTPAQAALKTGNRPVLLWWHDGLGKIAVLGVDGTWRWAMDAARKGEPPKIHRHFWRQLVRFLADPLKGASQRWRLTSDTDDHTPPPEWRAEPQPNRLKRWAQATGGAVLPTQRLAQTVTAPTKTITIPQRRHLSELPLPYLLLIATLLAEWWFIRRKGLL